MWKGILRVAALSALLLPAPAVVAQDTGTGSTTHGDIFGDLYHIKRDATTGQPILQKRWIEYPEDLLDWGYCVIPIDTLGNEVPFADLSCELDSASTAAVIEVDYFGRLSMGRSKESNLRMHFDEVINKIKDAQLVDRDPSGRLEIGTCDVVNGAIVPSSCTWRLVDSPGENLALYWRLLRYGHLQTDPREVDTSPGGDPALGTIYRTALTAADYSKFQGVMQSLLPVTPAQASSCFSGADFTCDEPQLLDGNDFGIAASFLGTAADKTGRITTDLVQYLNRILKLTETTPMGAATLRTLPVLIRDCGDDANNQLPIEQCTIREPNAMELGLALPAVNERFVDFSVVDYHRADWFDSALEVLKPFSFDNWVRATDVQLRNWLAFINPAGDQGSNVAGFVKAGNDAVRSVQFLHEYEVPTDLGWDFDSIIVEDPPLVVLGLVADKASPQAAGTTIMLTATATGGTPPIQFKFTVSDGGAPIVLRDWGPANTCAWKPLVPSATYVLSVWARSSANTVDAPEKINAQDQLPFPIGSALVVQSLGAAPPSPQPATTVITFTVAASRGILPYQYKWEQKNGDTWDLLANFSNLPTLAWPAPSDGTYTIRITVKDAEGVQAQQTIEFVVAPAPPPPPAPPPSAPESPSPSRTQPAAADDGFTTTFAAPLIVAAPGVLDNDDPGDGGPLNAVLQSGVANGTLTFSADGSFMYLPNPTFAGADAFTYRASNGNGTTNTATVSIVVSAPSGPYGLHAEYVDGNTVRLDWILPPGIAVTDFVVDGGTLPGTTTVSVPVGGPQPTLTFDIPDGVYFAHVHGVTPHGLTPESNEVTLYVNVPATPAPPMNLVGLANGTALSLAWHNNYAAGQPTSLMLDISGALTTTVPLAMANTFNYASVPAGTYTFAVRAVNALGSSAPSNPVTLAFPSGCSGAPGVPTNFSAYRNNTVVTATWDPPAGGSAPTSYVLNVIGSYTGSFPTTAQSLSGEVGPGSYGLTVTAVNACGAGAPTPVVTVVVP
jgi:hypothetical protein